METYSQSDFKYLAKVFLSHASPDKPFVRRLNLRLNKAGVDTWLDERELVVGDSLPEEIFKAIHAAQAVIIVVSESSLQSDWLRNELRVAAQRMIDGKCRLIPVKRDDVDPPPEMTGLLYADCRPGVRGGTEQILKGLSERSAAVKRETVTMDDSDAMVRWRGLLSAISDIFESSWSGDAVFSATHSISFEYVNVFTDSGREVEVIYDTISDYLLDGKVLVLQDWEDWKATITDQLGGRFGLLISERGPSPTMTSSMTKTAESVWVERLPASLSEPGGAMVFVHLGLPISDEETGKRIESAKDALISEANFQVPTLRPLGEILGHSKPADQ
jgi:predicted secreted protein